jgi:Putative glycerate kinase
LSKDQLTQLRSIAREIFEAALLAVDAREVTHKAIGVEGNRVTIGHTVLDATKPIYVVSLGKASVAMAEALNETLGDRIANGIITGQQPQRLNANWQVFSGGHPLPNTDSLNAASAAFQLLDKANDEQAVVIFAVSGGGSAMIEWPSTSAISLEDLREANRIMVACGATIAEVNTVRRTFSAVKGGKLAARAPKAEIVTLLISDTNHGDEGSVASGPSLPPSDTRAATEIVAKYQLEAKLPGTIIEAIRKSEEPIQTAQTRESHYILAENKTALDAAAARATSLGFRAVRADEISEQPIAEGCELLIQRLAKEPAPVCLISGGEFACTVRGDGRGGRNLETVLRCALAVAAHNEHIVVLSAGTDGIDGNSPAAGAVADETTLSRAESLGLDASSLLERSDSFGFFKRLGDAIITGPTSTNVRDVRVIIKVAVE